MLVREEGISVFIICCLLPVDGHLDSTTDGHGVEGVWVGRGENILRNLIHRCLVSGLWQGGVRLDDVLLLLLGFGLQQVGGVVMGWEFLTHEQRC